MFQKLSAQLRGQNVSSLFLRDAKEIIQNKKRCMDLLYQNKTDKKEPLSLRSLLSHGKSKKSHVSWKRVSDKTQLLRRQNATHPCLMELRPFVQQDGGHKFKTGCLMVSSLWPCYGTIQKNTITCTATINSKFAIHKLCCEELWTLKTFGGVEFYLYSHLLHIPACSEQIATSKLIGLSKWTVELYCDWW